MKHYYSFFVGACLFLASGQVFAQPKMITFEDGTKMKFELLSQRSETPVKWSAAAGAGYAGFTGDGVGAVVVDLLGHYNLSNEFELSLASSIGVFSGDVLESSPSYLNVDALAAYSFYSKTRVKKKGITLKSTARGNVTTNYVQEIPLERTFRLEAIGGLQYIQSGVNMWNSWLNAATGDRPEYYIDGMQNTNLKLGLSMRFNHRLLYALDDKITPLGRDIRYFAMVLVPVSNSFSTDIPVPEAVLASHDGDISNIGFTLGVQRKGFVFNGALAITRVSLSQLPNHSEAGLLFNISYIVGFGPNSAKTYLD